MKEANNSNSILLVNPDILPCVGRKKIKKESKNMFSSLYGYFLMIGCPSQTSLHSWCAELCARSQHCVPKMTILRMSPLINLVQKVEKTHIPHPQWVRVVCV